MKKTSNRLHSLFAALAALILAAALAVSLAWTVPAYAEEFVPGPGRPYDDATMARIQDNVLEYEEIGLLVDTYNPTLKNVKDTYSDTKDDYKDVDKLKNQIMEGSGSLADQAGQLSGMAGTFEDLLGYQNMVTPGTYAELVYSSEVLSQQAEQMTLSADSLSAVTPEMLKVKMVDSTRAALVSGAQSAMIGYEQLLLQKESLEDSITLLEEVYKSTQTQASLGLATENAVLTARQNLESAQAGRLAMDASEVKLRQSLCTLLGWEYNGNPEIRKVPEADLSRIGAMDPAADKQAAIDNNYTLKYNRLSYEQLTDGSVEQQNMARTIEDQTAAISSSLENLYNQVLQKRNEYQTAVAALELEKTRMEAADRKMSVGTIGRLEYLQQKNSYAAKETAVKTADLALFQAMETYDQAVEGNLSVS